VIAEAAVMLIGPYDGANSGALMASIRTRENQHPISATPKLTAAGPNPSNPDLVVIRGPLNYAPPPTSDPMNFGMPSWMGHVANVLDSHVPALHAAASTLSGQFNPAQEAHMLAAPFEAVAHGIARAFGSSNRSNSASPFGNETAFEVGRYGYDPSLAGTAAPKPAARPQHVQAVAHVATGRMFRAF
jgi:hypothetical protein